MTEDKIATTLVSDARNLDRFNRRRGGGSVRLVILATCLASVPARADVPRGHYEMKKGRPHAVRARLDGSDLPSCGQVARAFIASIDRLDIHYSTSATVNSMTWIVDGVSKDTVSLVHLDLLEGLIAAIVLFELKGRRAFGSMKVVGLEGGRLRCADAVYLQGTFKR